MEYKKPVNFEYPKKEKFQSADESGNESENYDDEDNENESDSYDNTEKYKNKIMEFLKKK